MLASVGSLKQLGIKDEAHGQLLEVKQNPEAVNLWSSEAKTWKETEPDRWIYSLEKKIEETKLRFKEKYLIPRLVDLHNDLEAVCGLIAFQINDRSNAYRD